MIGWTEASLIVGTELCQDHFLKTTAEELLTAELRAAIAEWYSRGQGLRPDFERASKFPVEIGSAEFQSYVIRMESARKSKAVA